MVSIGSHTLHPVWTPTGPVQAIPAAGVQTAVPAAQPAAPGFVNTAANPFAAPAAAPAASAASQAMADSVYNDVVGNAGTRQAAANYDHAGRTAAMNAKVGPAVQEILDAVTSGRISGAEGDRLIQQRAVAIEAELDAQFGKIPASPDAVPRPANAYDWQARSAREKELIAPITQPLVDALARGELSPEQFEKLVQERTAGVSAQLDAELGKPPEVLTPETIGRTPGYPYDQRAAESADLVKPMVAEIVQGVVNGTIAPDQADRMVAEKAAEIDRQMDAKYGPTPPPKPYDGAMDTKEAYDQNRWQMESQMQAMQASGATPDKVLGYKLQRQAQLAQMFPKQAALGEAQDEWKAVAMQMQAAGKSEGEIREYLNRKAAEFKEMSPEELTAFSARKAQEAAEIGMLVQALGKNGGKAQEQKFEF